MSSRLIERIEDVIEAPLKSRGYGVVQIRIIGGKSGTTLEVDIDRLDDKPVSIEDCVLVNHVVSTILDVEDLIKNSYRLNISSPGEERPLTKIADYERFCGKDIKLELIYPLNARKRFCGKLVKIERNANDTIVYLKEECDNGVTEIDFSYKNIKKARVKRDF